MLSILQPSVENSNTNQNLHNKFFKYTLLKRGLFFVSHSGGFGMLQEVMVMELYVLVLHSSSLQMHFICEANFVELSHHKQEFERVTVLARKALLVCFPCLSIEYY